MRSRDESSWDKRSPSFNFERTHESAEERHIRSQRAGLDRIDTAQALFELFATADRRAPGLLAAIDAGGAEASSQIEKLRELAAAARALLSDPPPTPPGQVRDVA